MCEKKGSNSNFSRLSAVPPFPLPTSPPQLVPIAARPLILKTRSLLIPEGKGGLLAVYTCCTALTKTQYIYDLVHITLRHMKITLN